MSKQPPPSQQYTPAEELANTITHGVGVALSIAAIAILVTFASLRGGARHVVTCAIFGVSLLVLYVASTGFHLCRGTRLKHCFRIFDHTAIYFLIAGSYTPFLLVMVRGSWGWSLFAVLWAMALIGTWVKVHFTGQFDKTSTAIYVAMGWIGLLALRPFLELIPGGALLWILAGGLAYTLGVVFYLWERLPFNHAVWHLFVLAGSICHFFAVLFYVVP